MIALTSLFASISLAITVVGSASKNTKHKTPNANKRIVIMSCERFILLGIGLFKFVIANWVDD